MGGDSLFPCVKSTFKPYRRGRFAPEFFPAENSMEELAGALGVPSEMDGGDDDDGRDEYDVEARLVVKCTKKKKKKIKRKPPPQLHDTTVSSSLSRPTRNTSDGIHQPTAGIQGCAPHSIVKKRHSHVERKNERTRIRVE